MPEAAVSANWQRGMADNEVAGIKNAMAGVRRLSARIGPHR